MPAAGWAQIIFLVGLHELTVAKQDYTKVPGEIPTFLSFKPEDPDVRSRTRAPQWQASGHHQAGIRPDRSWRREVR